MKKVFGILLISLVIVLGAVGLSACSTGGAGGGAVTNELPGVIENATGEYKPPHNSAYGEEPDLDNVVIDGYLDDQLWTADEMKWYTHYEANSRIRYEMAATVSEGGLYIAFRSYDPIVAWFGYNYFYRNTNVTFHLYASDHGGKDISIQMDANNVRPVGYYINARCQYYGELNFAGKGEGISSEVYVAWEDIGIEVSEGAPEYMAILPVYNYCISTVVGQTTTMYPTFVKTTGNRKQAVTFDQNGYVDGDEEGSIVGSHESGLAKTNGWTISNEDGDEIATSNYTATAGFPQVAFFRESLSSIFKVTTTINFGKGTNDSRAGIIMYRDSINYRAVALQYVGGSHNPGDYLYQYKLNGYTNYPANITVTSKVYEAESEYGYDSAELTVYNNMGKLYYVLDGKFVGSESASYVAINNYIGLYAFDTTTTFSDYECVSFDTESELLEDFSEYAYTVDVFNETSAVLVATTDQLAVTKQNGSVEVTLNFERGYTLDEIMYSIDGGELQSAEEYAEAAQGGVFTMPVDGNVTIYTTAKRIEEGLIDVGLETVDVDTGDSVIGIEATLIGSGKYTRYTVRFNSPSAVVQLPAGYSWKYVASGSGYRVTEGDLLDGEVIEQSTLDAVILVKALIMGGTALPPADENGNNIINFTKTSIPGVVFDISKGEEGLVIFQTSQSDAGEVYFSGRTISDYQVAYVEIINRTDPSAFTSFENDPAAGFLIAGPKGTSYIGARVDGLRIIPNRLVFSQRSDVTGILGWDGYLANTDRQNGGRFLNGYAGKGSTNRIPHDGIEYTTSLLLIRKGGYTFIYAADGKADVREDKTNFNKMQLVYSFYNSMTDGYAAVGFGTTCNYNLRMDFENYWILCGDRASEFVGTTLERKFAVGGAKEQVTVEGDGIVGYDQESGDGKCVTGAELTVKATAVTENKMLKVKASTGETYYLYEKGDKIKHKHNGGATKLTFTVTEVEYDVISGKVIAPEGVNTRLFDGYLYDEAGNVIMEIITDENGEFSYHIEKGATTKVSFNLDGYAMDPVTVGTQPVELSFTEIPLASKITKVTGAKASSYDGAKYGYNDEDGAYFELNYECPASNYVYIKESNTYESMVIDFNYERFNAPSNYYGSVDTDIGFGATFFGATGSYGMRFVGDGCRILMDDKFGSAFNLTERGLGGANLGVLYTPQPYQMRFIKYGSMVYMCSKTLHADKYALVYSLDLMPHVGSLYTDVALTWMSVGWTALKISNITVTEITTQTLPELLSDVKLCEFTLSGATDYVSVSGAKLVSYDDSVGKGTIGHGSEFTIQAKELPEGKLLKVVCGKSESIIISGGKTTVTAPKSGNATVELSLIDGFTVNGSVIAPDDVKTKKFNGSVRDADGKIYSEFSTDNNGNFIVFVDKATDYYLHFYCDGYVNTPVKIVEGASLDGITFKKCCLVSSITRLDGEVDAAPIYDVPVYEKVNGSLAFDVKDGQAKIEGLFIRPELVGEDMEISFTFERRAMPAGSGFSEDKDASLGLNVFGKDAYYGARFIGTGYRVMRDDVFNKATNLEQRGIGTVDMSVITPAEPYNFKFVKIGKELSMYSKLQSQSEYTLVYTLDLMNSDHNIGSVMADISISWCFWGYADFTISDVKVTNLSEA